MFCVLCKLFLLDCPPFLPSFLRLEGHLYILSMVYLSYTVMTVLYIRHSARCQFLPFTSAILLRASRWPWLRWWITLKVTLSHSKPKLRRVIVDSARTRRVRRGIGVTRGVKVKNVTVAFPPVVLVSPTPQTVSPLLIICTIILVAQKRPKKARGARCGKACICLLSLNRWEFMEN